MTTSNASMLAEIREVNLSYLLLAQRLLQEDRPSAMFRMGLSEQLADILASLNLAQVVKVAASNQLLCRFRFDDHAILSSLADKEKSRRARAHPCRDPDGEPARRSRSAERGRAVYMARKSVVAEVREITLAIELIELGARLQLLEAETSLSRDRLIQPL